MNSTLLHYRFLIDPEADIATLEAVLAVVRRLGMELRGLRTAATGRGLDVVLSVAAPQEALALCRMRLHNLVGIGAIRTERRLGAA